MSRDMWTPSIHRTPNRAAVTVGAMSSPAASAFSHVALAAVANAGRELLEEGTTRWLGQAAEGRRLAAAAFGTN